MLHLPITPHWYLAYLLDIHGNWLEMANVNIELPPLSCSLDTWRDVGSKLSMLSSRKENTRDTWVDFNFMLPIKHLWSFP